MDQIKVKLQKKRRLKSFIFLNVFGILSLAAVTISSCATSNSNARLVFANFESYMSPDLQNELQDEYSNLTFDYYSSNENMISNFKNGTYTIGVPSTYAVIELVQDQQLEPIDWGKFGLHQPGDSNVLIKNADDALNLFTKPVQDILTGYKNYGINNLLEYSIPYFFQDYIFAYRGAAIPEFQEDQQPTWSQILDYVGSHPERFNNGRFGAVEDERSLFSVAKLIENSEIGVEPISVNPQNDNPKPSIAEYMDIFDNLSKNNRINSTTLGSNHVPVFLNSDSNVILNSLALGNLTGAMLYNGDAIFAALGGDIASTAKPTGDDFHIVTPKYTPLALDLMVINKISTRSNPKVLNQAYDIIKKVALEGVDETDPEVFQDIKPGAETISGDPRYVNGPMQNFSYILYTSPLKIISGATNSVVNDDEGGFFNDDIDERLLHEITSAYNIDLGANVIPGNINNFIEQPINAWQKQAMINAYLRFKEEMWT